MQPENPPPKRLEVQLREAARLKHLSLRTEEAYWGWVKRFVIFHGRRHPAEMGEIEVRDFLTHLAVERQVAASTLNQALKMYLPRRHEGGTDDARDGVLRL